MDKFCVSWVAVLFPFSFTKIREEVFTRKFWKKHSNANKYCWNRILLDIPNTIKFNFFCSNVQMFSATNQPHGMKLKPSIVGRGFLIPPFFESPYIAYPFLFKFWPTLFLPQTQTQTHPKLYFSFCYFVSLTEWVIASHLMFYFT